MNCKDCSKYADCPHATDGERSSCGKSPIDNDFVKALEGELHRENYEYKDLMNDFEFVRELNKELSLKYQDFVDSLPKPQEVDLIIEAIKAKIKDLTDKVEIEVLNKRLFQLTRFRGATVLLEKDNIEGKPVKYEDLFGNGA